MTYPLLPAHLLKRGLQHGLLLNRSSLWRLSSASQAALSCVTFPCLNSTPLASATATHSTLPSVRAKAQSSFSSSHRLYSTSPETSTDSPAATDELILSSSCIDRIRQLNAASDGGGEDSSADANKSSFLRIVVEGGGCSGFQYKFELDNDLQSDDRCFGPSDARVVIDELSLSLVKGSTVEYHTELIRAAFRIVDNPLSESGCSCGASFSVKL